MSLGTRLAELRRLALRPLAAFTVGWALAWMARLHLLEWLTRPLAEQWNAMPGQGPALLLEPPVELFSSYLRMSTAAGVFAALPFVVLQAIRFYRPGALGFARSGAFVLTSYLGIVLAAIGTRALLLPELTFQIFLLTAPADVVPTSVIANDACRFRG